MSLLNHYGAYTDFMFERLNDRDGAEPMPRFDGDINEFWRNWITRGWFDWEHEGYPFWSNLHHTQSYWDHRLLPNILFIHYADMINDTPAMIQRIAAFIDHPVTMGDIEDTARAVSFKRVKQQAAAESAKTQDSPQAFAGGSNTFINKGTNGRWRDVLSNEDLKLYETTKRKVLTPECAVWLENGGEVLK